MDKLSAAQKKLIHLRIRELDPKEELVSLNPTAAYSGGSISYAKTSGLTLGEHISKLTDEELVRAYLVVRLVTELRYPVRGFYRTRKGLHN